MSSQNVALNTGSQAIINTDLGKIFVWNKEDLRGDYTNTSGSEVTLNAGRLIGKVSATGALVPHDAVAVDGSQYVFGILLETVVVPDTETRTLFVCVNGSVVKSKVIYAAGQDATTEVDGRQLQDRIMGDTKGILLVDEGEQSAYDNQ